MRTKSQSDCPSIDQLAEALDALQPLDATITKHIEVCRECQQTMAGIAGDETWWDDARLNLSKIQAASAFRVADSVCVLSEEVDSAAVTDPLQQHEVKQLQALLEPACHPELLGRLGRYELEQLIGRGGMGLVFRAHDTELHRVVAVKTLAIHLIPIGAARERFIREGRAAASLVHPHIVPVHDVVTDGPVPALVMQYIAGPSLEQWIAQHGPMPWQQTLRIASQLTDALKLAHDQGLVHRDVKPGNVLLEANASRALLTDFGLVRTLDDATLTRSGMLTGTPDYMSPEQARGECVQHNSDLFSLGSVLYTMLTGHPPFRAPSAMAIMNRLCNEKHRSVCEVQPEIPVEVGTLVDRLLAKQTSKRVESAAELQAELQRLSKAQPRLAANSLRRRTLRSRAAIMIAGVALLIVAALIGPSTLPVFNVETSDTSVRFDAQNNGESSQGEALVKQRFSNLQMPVDVLELEEFDSQLSQVGQLVEGVLESSQATSRDRSSLTAPLGDIDQQLDSLLEDLQRIESELSGQ